MKIALLGYGLEARSAYTFLKAKYPTAKFEIYDQSQSSKLSTPPEAEVFLGVNDFSTIQADLLVRTPAVNPKDLPSGSNVTSVTNLFFSNCRAPIIGITGSKGKGTTASLVTEICQAAGVNTHLVGNIGVPALDSLSEIRSQDIVVYELSSFQLWDIEHSPHIAIITNIEPDHLDVHDDFEDYISAKSNIGRYQSAADILIYNAKDDLVKQMVGSLQTSSPAKTISFPSSSAANIQNNKFYWEETELASVISLKLPGQHNQLNALAAITASVEILKEKNFTLEQISTFIEKGLSAFEGLPHRLKFVRNFEGIDFYDDSIATTPGSAIAAVRSFSQPKIMILGGSDKGGDMSELIDMISQSKPDEIRKIILIGDEAQNLQSQLEAKAYENFINLGLDISMDEIVEVSAREAHPGDTVILSPAHASFDMFKSYSDRGDQFIKAVNNLKKETV